MARNFRLRPKRTLAKRIDEPRMRSVFSAAVQHKGRVEAMLQTLRLSQRTLNHRLSVLRHHGVGYWISIWDPRKAGRPLEAIILLGTASFAAPSLAKLEKLIQDDPRVTSAVRICGDFDYRLVAYFHDHAEAAVWCQNLAQNPLVKSLTHKFIETRFGDNLFGLRLEMDPLNKTPASENRWT